LPFYGLLKGKSMLSKQKVCKWITDKVEEGRGAVIFSLEENNGMVGVWVGDPEEHERALGYGDDVVSAVLDAIGKEAAQQSVRRALFPACADCEYNPCDFENNFDYCPAPARR
jgi:hypothetical protein